MEQLDRRLLKKMNTKRNDISASSNKRLLPRNYRSKTSVDTFNTVDILPAILVDANEVYSLRHRFVTAEKLKVLIVRQRY